jgi:hypothetical protein
VQGLQDDDAVKPVLLLKVPFGHKYSVPKAVPAGQYDPAGHTDGLIVPDTHTLPAGHTLHVSLPARSWNVPAAHDNGEALPVGQ